MHGIRERLKINGSWSFVPDPIGDFPALPMLPIAGFCRKVPRERMGNEKGKEDERDKGGEETEEYTRGR